MTITRPDYGASLEKIIRCYDEYMDTADADAKRQTDRAYGGVLRGRKGGLVETIAQQMIAIAWLRTGGDRNHLWFDSQKTTIPIRREILHKFPPDVAEHIRARFDKFAYKISTDIQVMLNGRFVLGIECKSYTEIAMYKRILVDFTLLKTQHAHMRCCLIQLENMLGEGYDNTPAQNIGSPSGRTLDSYFPAVQLDVITLLGGVRKVKEPIHDKRYKKPLTESALNAGITKFQNILSAISA